MDRKRLTIIIDSNVFWQDRRQSSPKWEEFRAIHNFYDCSIKLPPVVCIELVGLRHQDILKKKKEIDEAVRKLERSIKELNSHVFVLSNEQIPTFDPNELLKKIGHQGISIDQGEKVYALQLTDISNFVGAEVMPLPWPSIGHEEVVKRCSILKAPFTSESGKDKGYKDFLFWASVLNESKTNRDLIVVITADLAFFNPNNDNWHADLQEDLTQSGKKPGEVAIFKDLSEVIERFISPYMKQDDEFAEQLRKDRCNQIGTQLNSIKEEFEDELIKCFPPLSNILNKTDRHALETITTIISFVPVVLEVVSSRKLPNESWLAEVRVLCKFHIRKEMKILFDGLMTMNEIETYWVATELQSELVLSTKKNLLAASILIEKGLSLTDFANCRLTQTVDEKGFCLEVYAEMELADSKVFTQHWNKNELDQCLREFGVNEPVGAVESNVDDKKIYTVSRVPFPIIRKWGYKTPETNEFRMRIN
jgi:hypothetical protein